ncbi:MAG: GDP-mannose 4,6-dehydratase [Bacteroidales bacterium]|nr:GDP-mannose 4,6-dehydratase [Candidatus Latescibacterota bacterium]
MRRALITGITGMDGSHMADLLLEKGYEVYGMERHRSSGSDYTNISHILNQITLLKGDLADTASLIKVVEQAEPDEIYNFAAQSFVGDSWRMAEFTSNVTGLGALRLLEVINEIAPGARFVQASTSEMFGKQEVDIADESTVFAPQSPYGISKVFAHHMVENYRQAYGLFACASICFNHESERRGIQFVTRKITHGVANIFTGRKSHIMLGNVLPRRDWGYAPEYVEGIWRMLQQESPDDYILATGESHSVADFVRAAFAVLGVEDWKQYVMQDERFMRPVEVNYLRGNAQKAKANLGWEPTTKFDALVRKMVENDLTLCDERYHA